MNPFSITATCIATVSLAANLVHTGQIQDLNRIIKNQDRTISALHISSYERFVNNEQGLER